MNDNSVASPARKTPAPAHPRIAAGNLRHDLDLTSSELRRLLDLAAEIKRSPARFRHALDGQTVALLFEKPSLRTRLTFEVGVRQLGGDAVVSSGPVAEREPVKDVARNLERWTQAVVARTFRQETVDELARWAAVPVVNALTELYHPCQALADMLTLREKFPRLEGLKLAFVGDGNNVAHSLLLDATRLGMHFALASPAGYRAKQEIVAAAREQAAAQGTELVLTEDPAAAVEGADAVYTDVWASMGQEHEAVERNRCFAPYRVDEALMAKAGSQAVFMHCLPARRGQETTDGVIESPRSVVFDQAENRLHAQKALLVMLAARGVRQQL